ncbi:DUF4097 family beta strand repeat-containing protein [Cohnella laeviribosi]|uniref:DUF4097 family beta strand repeat-containing protein n=1 Tax=Cohnella laeviribosi TaxID=380174 RepID=UPI0003714585|nr:DUF4097 family beta strand repeat-containing protein [Cohnella laeviribosi]
MRNDVKMLLLLTIFILTSVASGCANSTVTWSGKVEESVIGAKSGSGELTREIKSFASKEFDSIRVNAEAMEIEVTRSSGHDAKVELLTDKAIENQFTFDAAIQSRELIIRIDEETKYYTIKGQRGERKLRISLPDQIYGQVVIETQFGFVDAADLKARSVDIMLSAGEIRLNRVSGNLLLKTEAGKITALGIDPANDISARTEAGDIDIVLDRSPKAVVVNLKSELGSVGTNLKNMEYTVQSANQIIATIGSNGTRIDAHAQVGDVLVHTK